MIITIALVSDINITLSNRYPFNNVCKVVDMYFIIGLSDNITIIYGFDQEVIALLLVSHSQKSYLDYVGYRRLLHCRLCNNYK
jgi:hypothetical protein